MTEQAKNLIADGTVLVWAVWYKMPVLIALLERVLN